MRPSSTSPSICLTDNADGAENTARLIAVWKTLRDFGRACAYFGHGRTRYSSYYRSDVPFSKYPKIIAHAPCSVSRFQLVSTSRRGFGGCFALALQRPCVNSYTAFFDQFNLWLFCCALNTKLAKETLVIAISNQTCLTHAAYFPNCIYHVDVQLAMTGSCFYFRQVSSSATLLRLCLFSIGTVISAIKAF